MYRYLRPKMASRSLFLLLLVIGLSAQIPFKLPKIFSNPFEKEDALTTSLADAITEVPYLDDFDPQDMAPLSIFPRSESGDFVVQKPGAYEFLARSYCLRAGTYGPGKGNGYIYAPLKGPSADIIRNVLQRSVTHREVSQHEVQALLWAIIAKTKPSKMNGELSNTTRILLTREEISKLEGSAFDEVSQDAFRRALGKLPPETQRVMDAERKLRDAFTMGNMPFNELERIAVLTGEPMPGKDDRNVPSGRWSFQPDGYFIRYFPNGYPTTLVEVYFPENFAIRRDTSGRIVSISDQSGKRLDIEYDDAIIPLRVNGEQSLTGSAFRAVRLRFTIPKQPRVRAEIGTADISDWRNSGWTFSGSFAGRGSVSSAAGRFAGAGGRYETARRNADELRKMADSLTRLPKGTNIMTVSSTTMDDLFGLMQLAAGLNDMCSAMGIDRSVQFFDPVEFVQRAWASEFARSVGIQPIGEVETLSPSIFRNAGYSPYESLLRPPAGKDFGFGGGAAMPGSRGRQREGISDAPQEPNDECKENYSSCSDSAGTSYAACNLDCLQNGTGTLSQLNEARKCMGRCQTAYNNANRQCTTASKKCLKR